MSKRPPDTVNRMSVHRSVGELLQKTFCEKNVWNKRRYLWFHCIDFLYVYSDRAHLTPAHPGEGLCVVKGASCCLCGGM